MENQTLNLFRNTIAEYLLKAEQGYYELKIPKIRSLKLFAPQMKYHMTPEVFFQLENSTIFTFPNEEFILNPGQICIVPPNVPHLEIIKKTDSPFLNIVLSFQTSTFSLHSAIERANNPRKIRIKDAIFFKTGYLQTLESCLNNIATFYHDPDLQNAVNGLLIAILTTVEKTLRTSESPELKGNYNVLKCLDLIQANLFDSKLNVKFLAEQLQLSPNYLSNLFAKSQNTTIIEYINNHRISIAYSYLKNTSLNISEISKACGYNDPAYFRRIFKNKYQTSPKTFRKS